MLRRFGVGRYAALRVADAVILIVATGMASDPTTHVTLERLPRRVSPPRFALFFDEAPIVSATTRPFVVTGVFAYPESAASVTIIDATGRHAIKIADAIDAEKPQERSANIEYLVYRQLNSTGCLIAPSDHVLPAVYTRAFGPAPFAACEAWSAENCGE